MAKTRVDLQSQARASLRVVLKRTGNKWQASLADLSATGHNSRTARRIISDLARERYGPKPLQFEIALPKTHDAALRRFHADERELRSLAESVPEKRLRCIRDLLALNLSQEEVAELLGMSRSHLAVTLKRAQTHGTGPLDRAPKLRQVNSR